MGERMNQTLPMSRDPRATSFPIVGIGGSAGGLEAFQNLLKNLSDKPGMAFVFIMHLAPEHKSMLSALLSRVTKMPVSEVKNRMPLEVNHVYVIPPKTSMSLASRKLMINKIKDIQLKRMPIDHFFRSLADEQGNRSIGVILSGTATDGTLGAEAIKANGGIVFAQDENSAKYPGMPQNAVNAGCVDFVLSPEKIARELKRLAKHPLLLSPGLLHTGQPISAKDKGLESIFELLRSVKKLDFTQYKSPTVSRRVSRRMVLLKLKKLEHYVKFLRRNTDEVENLYEDLLINVTSFFRDPKVFVALKKKILPAILKKKTKDQEVRIWVPGCASGEEAYSIGICLIEALGNQAGTVPIQIFATDVNEGSIHKARRGIYGDHRKNDVTPERLKRFFTKEGHSYKISKQLREMCIFSKQNVFSDPPFSNMDMISCRNLLIYLQPVLQKNVFHKFHYALRPGGFLLLGNSEFPGGSSDLFKALDGKNKIFVNKHLPVEPKLQLDPPYYPPKKLEIKEIDIAGIADRIVLSQFAPCGVLINDEMDVVQFRGHTGHYLESAAGKPSLNLFRLAREGLFLPLRAAVYKARKTRHTVKREVENVKVNDRSARVHITVVPVGSASLKEEFFLVLFDEITGATPSRNLPKTHGKISLKGKSVKKDEAVNDLLQELAETKEYLQTVLEDQEGANEEVKAANEEIMSSNEELQSTNEELETAKEELQSSNEELITTNEELQNRNLEASLLNNDLINLLSSINMPVVMMGTNLVIRRITPQAEKALNIISSDIGRPISKIKLRVDIPDLEKTLLGVIKSLQPQTFEAKSRGGEWYSIYIRPYRTLDGKIDGVVAIFVDITERKKAQQIIKDARQYAENIIETIQESLVVLGDDLRVVSANKAFYQTFKVNPEQTQGRLFYDVGNRQWDTPHLRKLLEEIISNASTFGSCEIERDFETIGPKTMVLNARRFVTMRMILISISDVTEMKLAEKRMAKLASLVESSVDAIIGETLEGTVTSWNSGAERLYGYLPQEIIGKSISSLVPPEHVCELPDLLEKIKLGKCIEQYETVQIRKDRSAVDVAITMSPVTRPETGEVIGASVIARDITERKRIDKKIQETTKIKDDFTAMVSHELRTPLAVIKEGLDIVMDGTSGPLNADQQKYLETANRNVDRLGRLINDVLDYQKFESGHVGFDMELEDMNRLVREITQGFLPVAEKKDLALTAVYQKDLPQVMCDKDKITQVLTNLISNAVKFTSEGGVKVTTDSGDNWIRVSVHDTGAGIKAEDRARLFQSFSQLSISGARKTGGTGLGLAISKEIVIRHHGRIEVDSALGKGSTFHMILPISDRRQH